MSLKGDISSSGMSLGLGNNLRLLTHDVDGDGDEDLVVGNGGGTLLYFEKGSGGFNKKTGDDNPFDGIDPGANSAPAIDENGNLFIGYNNNGLRVNYYEKDDSGDYVQKTGNQNPLDGFTVNPVGVGPVLHFVELVDYEDNNAGGLFSNTASGYGKELVIGGVIGAAVGGGDDIIGYARGATATSPFSLVGTVVDSSEQPWTYFGNVGWRRPTHAAPYFINLDNDDPLEIIVGEGDGYLMRFDRQGTSYVASSQLFINRDFGVRPSPTFTDVDGDNDQDLLVGTDGGQLIYYQRNAQGGYAEQNTRISPFAWSELWLGNKRVTFCQC